MADVPAKSEPPNLPAPINTELPTPRSGWQTNPPGPPGAAVDPPPCSPSGQPFQAMTAPIDTAAVEPQAEPTWPPPEMQTPAQLEQIADAFMLTAKRTTPPLMPEPKIPALPMAEMKTDPTTRIGLQIPVAEIERALKASRNLKPPAQ